MVCVLNLIVRKIKFKKISFKLIKYGFKVFRSNFQVVLRNSPLKIQFKVLDICLKVSLVLVLASAFGFYSHETTPLLNLAALKPLVNM